MICNKRTWQAKSRWYGNRNLVENVENKTLIWTNPFQSQYYKREIIEVCFKIVWRKEERKGDRSSETERKRERARTSCEYNRECVLYMSFATKNIRNNLLLRYKRTIITPYIHRMYELVIVRHFSIFSAGIFVFPLFYLAHFSSLSSSSDYTHGCNK